MIAPKVMSNPAHNDAELVQASLAGKRGAFERIVERYQSLICSLAYGATGNLGRSEELAQETFVTAWKQLPELREPSKLRAWLCGIARNLISNAQRRAGRDPASLGEPLHAVHELAAAEPSPPELIITREEEAILWRALEKIPDTYREPLILFYREHKSIETVAYELDLSEDAVKQRLSRGRMLLHEQVLTFVEGTLERTAPGRTFTNAVLSVLPSAGTATSAAVLGATATKSSGAAKAVSATGAGFAAAILGMFGALGGYIGWQMGDTPAQTLAERASVIRFWRGVALASGLFLLPAFVLMFWHRTHPRVLEVAVWWLGLLYVVIAIGFTMYAGRQHRRIRARITTVEPVAPTSRKRLLLWTTIGTATMALVLVLAILDMGGWRTRRLNSVEAPAFIATHPAADFFILQYQDGSRVLEINTPENGHWKFYTAMLDANTQSALKQSGVRVKTLQQGRDFEILGWPGRYLFLLAFVIVAAGVVVLLRVRLAPKEEDPPPAQV